MHKINVKNVDYFHKFLTSVLKFVPSCKFIIDNEKCTVRSNSPESASRAFFTTNVITCDEEIEFCIGELGKLVKSVKTFIDYNKERNDFILTFDGAFLILKDNVSFKIRNIDENVIHTITDPLKTKLVPLYGFVLDKPMAKKLISMSFISLDSQHDPKIYIYKENDIIVGEVNDRTKQGIDSITIPISSNHFGNWGNPLVVNFDKFKAWNLLESNEVKVSYVTDERKIAQAIITISKIEDDEFYVKNKVLTSMLK